MGNKGGQALWRGVSIPTLSLEAKASIWVTEQTPGGNPHRNFADAALSERNCWGRRAFLPQPPEL